MSTFIALAITACIGLITVAAVLLAFQRFLPRSWITLPRWVRNLFRLAGRETIRYVDGPLAGHTAQQLSVSGGLPAFQITPVVTRIAAHGGDYTAPYERGLLCGTCRSWHDTEGWTHQDLAIQPVEEWPSWQKQSQPRCPADKSGQR